MNFIKFLVLDLEEERSYSKFLMDNYSGESN